MEPTLRERTIYERQAPDDRLVAASLAQSAPAVFWLQDAPAQDYPTLRGSQTADLTVVGGGYAGLWTAVLAKRRNPAQRVILLEAGTIGWAASGRNGGFCEASLTHGYDNGLARWPDELAELERLGEENLEELAQDLLDLRIDAEFERTGFLAVAVEEHQVPWLSDAPEAEVLDGPQIRAEIASPIFLGAAWDRHHTALVHPAKLARGLARAAADLGVEVFERSRVLSLDSARSGPVTLQTAKGSVASGQVALATNVFRPLLRRARHFTVPVYDYVLMTEPLSPAQLATVGWDHRQGFGDMAGQFHYSRLTADNRILYGGYDAIYHPGGRVDPAYEDRPESYQRLAAHFLTTFPQLEDLRFSHRWAGAIDTCTQFCAFHGLARGGRVAYTAGFTGLGVGATRFAAQVMLDRLEGLDTRRTRPAMVRRLPLPFPPEPVATVGIELTRRAIDSADHHQGRRNLFLRTLDAAGLGFDS